MKSTLNSLQSTAPRALALARPSPSMHLIEPAREPDREPTPPLTGRARRLRLALVLTRTLNLALALTHPVVGCAAAAR